MILLSLHDPKISSEKIIAGKKFFSKKTKH
jgi:hypothetical protein